VRIGAWASRTAVKRALTPLGRGSGVRGCTILTYHRVGGGTPDERDVEVADFRSHVELLADRVVVPIGQALDLLDAGDERPTVVLTFDDGFADVYQHAWPLLAEHGLPFTVYVTSGYVGRELVWEGTTARVPRGPAMTWDQLGEMHASGLCTIGNHTHLHPVPDDLDTDELDGCDAELARHLGVTPEHFAYPWGVVVPALEAELGRRYRSAVTGRIGRNHARTSRLRLRRLPVRRTDPLGFVALKVAGGLGPEHLYARMTDAAKRVGLRG
jgi:peptidoglycan/xylan/chitin deacetylase (PgdA/CDA1 family)